VIQRLTPQSSIPPACPHTAKYADSNSPPETMHRLICRDVPLARGTNLIRRILSHPWFTCQRHVPTNWWIRKKSTGCWLFTTHWLYVLYHLRAAL